MTNLYIFTMDTRGAMYGIGTYIGQLLRSVKGTDIMPTVVELNSSCREFEIKTKDGVRFISIPKPIIHSKTDFKTFISTIQNYAVYLLKEYINDTESNIFHLNRMEFLPLVKKLRENFTGKIVLTMHYTNWSLSLLGDKKQLKKILMKPTDTLSAFEREIYEEVTEGRELINNYCNKVIAISQHTYNDILSIYNAEENKVLLVNNALKDCYRSIPDVQKQKIRRKYHIGENEKVLIFAGRVDEVKGIDILVKAFGKVLEQYPECRLIIAGSGKYDNILALSREFSSKITFTGFIPRETLYRLYSIADIGIVPSIHEEFGFVAVEMMMHRLPLIVSDTTGLSEIVTDKETGVKVKLTKSTNTLANKIVELLSDPGLCRKYGQAGRQRYKARYDFPAFKKQMLKIYDTCQI